MTTEIPTKKKVPTKRPMQTKIASTFPVYSMDGKQSGSVKLPEAIFSAPWRADLVHQVTVALAANLRQNRAHTKDRSEVSGGGKKPWRQKGTGQARHGSNRSPIWRHGGITFGPRNTRNYSQKISKEMRVQALYSVLAQKARDGEVFIIDKLSFATPKTADAKLFLTALAASTGARGLLKTKNAALIALSGYNVDALKSFRNLGNVQTEETRNLNPLLVLSKKYLVIENPEMSFAILTARRASR